MALAGNEHDVAGTRAAHRLQNRLAPINLRDDGCVAQSPLSARVPVRVKRALGLTQLMPSTAKMLDKKVVSREQLFNPQTNLRVGFRYLRSLLDMFKGNVNLALLAYNRGEDAVWRDVRAGVDPGNGYDRWVMTDYKGKGLMQ